jgi:phosphatidylserine/phosphatidylglycerophosphate/cardiolipin synthase-like enzyme
VSNAVLADVCVERTKPKSVISHNKFIVKLRDGQPVAVWTGGTNFSKGGIFGHSNVAHVVEDAAVAKLFHDYWTVLATDPKHAALVEEVEAISPLPAGAPPVGTTPIFSPRSDLTALNRYAEYAMSAKAGLMMTFAFGMNDVFKAVYLNSTAPFRLALLEKKTRPMEDGPEKIAEEAAIQQLRNRPENVFAAGNLIGTSKIDGWVRERLSGLNSNVRYVHNKFMLIDPLGSDPIVIAGSANFSGTSTEDNDENMMVIRGNNRVADIYLGEFMRLWSHHAFRESLQWRSPDDPPKPLKTDDWWRDAFGNTERSARRSFFAPA